MLIYFFDLMISITCKLAIFLFSKFSISWVISSFKLLDLSSAISSKQTLLSTLLIALLSNLLPLSAFKRLEKLFFLG